MVSLSNSSRLPANTDRNGGEPSDVSPGPRQAINQPSRNRISNVDKNDGNRLGSVLGGYGCRRIGRDDHVNFETDQLISQGGESVELTLCVSILESYVLALNIAEFTKFSLERLDRESRGRGTDCEPTYLR